MHQRFWASELLMFEFPLANFAIDFRVLSSIVFGSCSCLRVVALPNCCFSYTTGDKLTYSVSGFLLSASRAAEMICVAVSVVVVVIAGRHPCPEHGC